MDSDVTEYTNGWKPLPLTLENVAKRWGFWVPLNAALAFGCDQPGLWKFLLIPFIPISLSLAMDAVGVTIKDPFPLALPTPFAKRPSKYFGGS